MGSGFTISESSILAALDQDQLEAVNSLTGPTCIIAGAGSGKTRTITHRIALGIARGVFTPNRVLALTYTNRAAAELRNRLRTLGAGGVTVRTFHSAALAQLQYFWPQLTSQRPPRVLPSKYKLLSEVVAELKLQLDEATIKEIAAEVEWRKYSLIDLEKYSDLERTVTGISSGVLNQILKQYEAQKLAKKLIDWEDVLLLCLGMLESEPRVLSHVQSQYRFFTVDEYQDISPLQQALLEVWLGDRSEICVVGDPRQTIYSFAGAASKFLTDFENKYPTSSVISLLKNYRSSPEILAVANRVLEDEPLQAVQSQKGEVKLSEHSSDQSEVEEVVNQILSQIAAGKSARDIAVLTRMNYQLEPFEAALKDHGIPALLRGSGRFFQRPEVMQASSAIRALALKSDREPLFIEISNILSGMGWTSRPSNDEKWQSLNWFVEVLEELGEAAELEEYLRELDERTSSIHEPERNAVTLATVHSAKGLEWDTVFLPSLNQGVFPGSRAVSEQELAEERRLFYVAVTRAKSNLIVSYTKNKEPSVFIKSLI